MFETSLDLSGAHPGNIFVLNYAGTHAGTNWYYDRVNLY